jgi:hypothetical protein
MKILTILCLLIVAASATAEVPRLMDTDGPAEGVVRLELEELWRVGGEDEDVLFGRIVNLTGGPDGNVYILDNQLCQVTVISPEGEFVTTLGREGDGPGEVRQAIGLAVMDDGMVAIASGFPGKAVRLHADGTPADTVYPIGVPADGHVGVMISLQWADGVLAGSGARLVMDPSGQTENYADRFLAVCTGDCAEPVRILRKKTPLDPTAQKYVERDDYYIDRRWVMGSGALIYAPMERDAYEISVFDRTGELQRVFGRTYEQRERTQEDKEAVAPLINVSGRFAETVAEDRDECVARLMYDFDDDSVWSLSAHGANEPEDGEVLESWDVFSADGEYLRQVQVPRGEEIVNGASFLVGGGRLVVLRGVSSSFDSEDEDEETEDPEEIEVEPLEVICYRFR